jgi:hypothetical protein
MNNRLILEEIENDSLDAILALSPEQKVKYFSALLKQFYPNVEINSDKYKDLLQNYVSSFYVEKLYRSNRFFNEKFIPIYTDTGLIRNIVADIFFTDDHLITH